MFYTYLYIDPLKNEPIYVGKGKGDRAFQHLVRTHNKHFSARLKIIKSNGLEPIIKFLATNIDEELALLVETEAIMKYGRRDLGTGTLLNFTNGGEGTHGHIHTQETRLKMSLSHKGMKKTPEWEAKLTETKRRPMTEARKRNISLASPHSKRCTIDGVVIYESRRALVDALGYGKNGTGNKGFRYVAD